MSGRETEAIHSCDAGYTCAEDRGVPCKQGQSDLKCEMKAGRIAGIVIGILVGAGCLGLAAACNSHLQIHKSMLCYWRCGACGACRGVGAAIVSSILFMVRLQPTKAQWPQSSS